MVSFNDSGTEADALSDQDDGSYSRRRGRGPTKYTNCRYCGKAFPLREISAHARTAHFEASTKRTDCRKCGDSYPLREIKFHARLCDGIPTSKSSGSPVTVSAFDPVKNPAARLLPDSFSIPVGIDLESHIRDLIAKLDAIEEQAVLDWVRGRGYSVAPVAVDRVELLRIVTAELDDHEATAGPDRPLRHVGIHITRQVAEWLERGQQ